MSNDLQTLCTLELHDVEQDDWVQVLPAELENVINDKRCLKG